MRYNLALAFCVLSGSAMADPLFVNRSVELGLTHAYTGGWEHFVGGGVASFDCNGDLFPEVYLAGGAGSAALLLNTTEQRGGAVAFAEETPDALVLSGVTGAYPLDIDSDGFMDLFVMRVGANLLMRGGPDCSFTPFDLAFDGGNRWTTAFSATWEVGAERPTLAVGNYVDRENPEGPFMACDTNFLMRPEAGGYGVTELLPAYCPLSMLFSDWGRNGRQDLRISNDRHYYVHGGAEQMWEMGATPRLYTVADGWQEFTIWGMGIASRDISGDGRPEVFLTSMGDQKMQALDAARPGPAYLDATYTRGTTAHRPFAGGDGRPSTGWHVEFGDVDNDGLDDVFIAKGNVEQMPDSAFDDPNNLLMQAPDGTFSEYALSAGIATMDRSRGGALVDLNLDGKLDLVVTNRRVAVEVYENRTEGAGNWLLLDLHQTGMNPNAVGAWIEVETGDKTIHREITVGGGHASGSATFTHFGLGQNTIARVRVVWPNGGISDWVDVPLNEVLRIERAALTLLVNPI